MGGRADKTGQGAGQTKRDCMTLLAAVPRPLRTRHRTLATTLNLFSSSVCVGDRCATHSASS
jgi:hypothetical protein